MSRDSAFDEDQVLVRKQFGYAKVLDLYAITTHPACHAHALYNLGWIR